MTKTLKTEQDDSNNNIDWLLFPKSLVTRVSAGGRHFRNLRKNLAKEIYKLIYFPPSCLFTFFRVSRTLPDQTILGIHLDLIKI